MTEPWPRNKCDFTFPHVILCDSMSCLKQPTTICACEIRETSWAAVLFALVVHSLMTSQRPIFLHYWNNYGMEGFLPPNSTPMFCRFYSTFTEVWFRSVLRSLIIWLRQSKLNVLHSALTNLRWHCSHGHTTMTSQRVGVHSFESWPNEAVIWGSLYGETITRTNTQAWPHVWIVSDQI